MRYLYGKYIYVEDMEIHMMSDLLLKDSTDKAIELNVLLENASNDIRKAQRLNQNSKELKLVTLVHKRL